MSSADVWHPSNNPDGDMVPILEASVEEAKQRHPSATPEAPDNLTAADRCDRCSAGALYRLGHRVKTALELVLCHHHGKALAPVMSDWTIVGVNLGLMTELYAGDTRSQGSDHA